MNVALSDRQLTGLDDAHLVTLPSGHRLHGEAAEAFTALKQDAAREGFDLVIASSYRSFARQLKIWNGKARGERPVFDDAGNEVAIGDLDPPAQLAAIMRFSAIPGASRHHWGTDIDVYDAAMMPEGYELQLSPQEVAPGGMFAALHEWLDARMAAERSRGFFRPYDRDRGGVSPERWHLSYAPVARSLEASFCADTLCRAWDSEDAEEVLLREAFEQRLPEMFERYVAVAPHWCPAPRSAG